MAYIGTTPKDIRSFGKAKFDFTATQGQTVFTGLDDDGKTLGYTTGQITVYLNGILLDESDYTASGSNTITLASAANAGDILSVVALQTDIPNSDYVPATGGTFSGAVVANDGLTVNNDAATVLTVDRATSSGKIVDIKNSGTSVGSVGAHAGFITLGSGDTSLIFDSTANTIEPFNQNDLTSEDAAITLGWSSNRFKDLYLSGGVYLGGTGAANLLDDYEEGSWTPVLRTADSSTEPSYNVRQGDFVKIGRFVYVSGRIYAASTGPTGTSLEVHGLPFIANLNASLGWYGGATLGYYGNIASPTANSILVLLGPENNNTRMRFHWVTVGGSGQTTSYGYNVVSGTDIYFSVSYMTT